ncbi:MAG: hypothetical protein ACLUNZ_12955 [Evtepia sp.]
MIMPVYQPADSAGRHGPGKPCRSLAPELIVVAAYGRILPDEMLATAPIGLHQRPLRPCCPSTAGLPPSTGPS